MIEQSPAELTCNGEPIPFKGMKLTGVLDGLLFEAEIEQTFINPRDKSVEVVYTTPLPYSAVLLDIEVQLGDRSLTGVVVGRNKAIVEYEEAIAEGNTAIMVERDHGGFYTLNLGNLGPKETCIIKIRYAQVLPFEQRAIRLLIPTVIAPRFGNPITQGGLAPHQIPETSLEVAYPFDFSIEVRGDLAKSRISSPSHPIGVSHQIAEAGPSIRISLTSSTRMDRDLVLNIDQLSADTFALLGPDLGNPDGFTCLIAFCPRLNQTKTPLAVKFLVDCSGSMMGDSIESAKRSLESLVDRLGPGDRFSLSRFGDAVKHQSQSLLSLEDPTTRMSAQQWIDDLEADMGGTEMEKALKSTFKIKDEGASDVFVITDGEIFGVDSLLETATNSHQRIFVVGIGSSPTESTIQKLAEVTGGACDFVAPGESVEPAIIRMFARLRSPRAEQLEVVWPEGLEPIWQSALPRSAFDADTIHLYAFWDKPPKGMALLRAKSTGTQETIELASCTLPETPSRAGNLSRMAAHHRIETADVALAESTAVTYQLVTQYTNFLLVHEREEDERAKEMPDLVKVRQMLPAGYGGLGSAALDRAASRRNSEHTLKCMSMDAEGDHEIQQLSRRISKVSSKSSSNVHYSLDRVESMDFIDIPAFLRRHGDPVATSHSEIRSFKSLPDSRPITLVTWLLVQDPSDWPQTFEELTSLAVPVDLVTWLKIQGDDARWRHYSEERLISAFLLALINLPIFANLRKKSGGLTGFMEKVRGIERYSENPADKDLCRHIHSSFQDLQQDVWGKVINEVFDCMI